MVKLKPSYRYVLTALKDAPGGRLLAHELPDGNGRPGGASHIKLKEMERDEVIECAGDPPHPRYGYIITPFGLIVLAEHEKEMGK